MILALVLATARTGWRAVLPDSERLLDIGVSTALTLLAAFLAQRLLFLVVDRLARVIHRSGGLNEHAKQRANTVKVVLRHIVTTLVAAAALIHILSLFGWDVKPLLAGAGIVGVALGFGAQTVVRDIIAGIFILAEDQFGVGDLIEVNGKVATVESITLRITTLRDFNGYIHFVPNGELKVVTNRSRGWQRLAVDVPVAAGGDLDGAMRAVHEVVDELNADPKWHARLLDPIEVWGIESLGPSEATIRVVLRAKPGPDAPEVSRELRWRVHEALTRDGHRFSAGREVVLASAAGSAPKD